MVHDAWRPAIERRARLGTEWLDDLVPSKPVPVEFVRSRDGAAFVIEEGAKRAVKFGILAAALELNIGAYRDVSDAELAAFSDGVPVELFEADDGQAFLLVGGELRRARGIPMTHPIDSRRVASVERGADMDVAAANVSRRRLNEAMSGQFQVERIRAAVKRKGVVGTATAALNRASRALKKRRAD